MSVTITKKPLLHHLWFRIAATFALAVAGLLIYAPYLPRLVTEGYPVPVWPAPGSFANIEGSAAKDDLFQQQVKPVIPELARLLEEKEGKALIAYSPGKPVVAYYADGITAKTKFNSYSLAKSLVGALVFKALAEKKIESLEDPVGKYLPELGDAEFRRTSLRLFLDMRSGLLLQRKTTPEGEEKSYRNIQAQLLRFNPFASMIRLHAEGVQAVSNHLVIEPRNRNQYNYQNVNTAILGSVLEKVYNKPLNALLSEKIWKPAGAETAHWRQYYKDGPVSPYCCLYATAQDWVRVSVFLMKNGTSDHSFLPEDLWKKYMGEQLKASDLSQYVYQNHMRYSLLDRKDEPLQGKFVFFTGQYGQVVYLIPQHNLVVVRFGGKMQKLHSTVYMAGRSMLAP